MIGIIGGLSRLAGKCALVTGGARGLGREIASTFIREGATVFISDVNADAALRTASEIGAAAGLAHDVTDEGDWQRVLSAVATDRISLDILINNAGLAQTPSGNALEELDPDAWRRVTEVNGLGTALGCKHGLKAMRAKGGAIVNIASIASRLTSPEIVAYGFSKAGVTHLTRSAARAGAPYRVRCNAVHPGMVRTEMLKELQRAADDPSGDGFKIVIPMGEYQTEADIAAGVLFLASDEARFVTGAELVIDGGITLKGIEDVPPGASPGQRFKEGEVS
jgi:NAD(P)-dependent dehydrogenase (short-subunit alcohol dehydrogenase family)